jgi:hypothetical protein
VLALTELAWRQCYEYGFDPHGYAPGMPVPLFDNRPERCPFGHDLGPGRVQVGWSPCICEPAKEAVRRGRGMGHLRLSCRTCEDEFRTAVFYEPAHDVKQWHVR